MTDFTTGAVRDTGGKGRMDLLPMCALLRMSRHMENSIAPDPNTGVPHYPERNWEQGLPMHSMIDSALRHLVKYVDGQTDEDHLCAAATNLMMAMWTEEKMPEMQDIPSRLKKCVNTTGSAVEQLPGQMTIDELNKPFELCSCWHVRGNHFVCIGTKEVEECYCNGNVFECTHYLEKRKANLG